MKPRKFNVRRRKTRYRDRGVGWLDRLSQAFACEPQDRDELKEALRLACDHGLLDAETLAMIEGALQVSEMRVRDIMVPRIQMVVIQRDAPIKTILKVIVESGHSRFPVIGEDVDEVVGILLAKDVLAFFSDENETEFNIRECLRPVSYIPESKRLNVLLAEFRASRNHMAIVVDEYGGVSGLITIEDVVEQIVGDIDDEYDTDIGDNIFQHANDIFTVRAQTSIREFNEAFNVDFTDIDYETIGGMIMHELGHMPKRGEELTFENIRFKVLRADNRRVYLLKIILLSKDSD
ncbi:MAG: CBS domain-containing protein [Gammaproteobacteria bacterium]|nr:MAG: CBS domain-containing protein [Gammaproteobacteria bacterium]